MENKQLKAEKVNTVGCHGNDGVTIIIVGIGRGTCSREGCASSST